MAGSNDEAESVRPAGHYPKTSVGVRNCVPHPVSARIMSAPQTQVAGSLGEAESAQSAGHCFPATHMKRARYRRGWKSVWAGDTGAACQSLVKAQAVRRGWRLGAPGRLEPTPIWQSATAPTQRGDDDAGARRDGGDDLARLTPLGLDEPALNVARDAVREGAVVQFFGQ